MRIPPFPLHPRERALLLAIACRRLTHNCRSRDAFEAGLAAACIVYGVTETAMERFRPQIDRWWHDALRYRMRSASRLFQRLHAKHTAPAKTKTRPARPTFKRAHTY